MNNKAVIQSILYAHGSDGIEVVQIKKAIDGLTADEIYRMINDMKKEYDESDDMGVTIKNYGNRFYLVTKEEARDYISKLIHVKTRNPLSATLMETLAIIAYNQPCRRGTIEAIRNSDPSFAIDKLASLDLITKTRLKEPGNPYVYKVTKNFFNVFGLKSISELPKLQEYALDDDDEAVSFYDTNR